MSYQPPVLGREYQAKKWGVYVPSEPFPLENTTEFSLEVTLMLEATKAWLHKIFEFTPTTIELHRLRTIAQELASFYASVVIDTTGLSRIPHIPKEIFLRFQLEKGYTLAQMHELFQQPRKDSGRQLRLDQMHDHHEV